MVGCVNEDIRSRGHDVEQANLYVEELVGDDCIELHDNLYFEGASSCMNWCVWVCV